MGKNLFRGNKFPLEFETEFLKKTSDSMSIPTPFGGLVDPSLGSKVDQETFVPSGVKGAAPLGLPPPLGERGGHPRKFHRGFPDEKKNLKI